MGKITRATLKSFVNKNRDNLYIKVDGSFDGMTDMVEVNPNSGFKPAEQTDHVVEHTLGIAGMWLVLGGRDYLTTYEDERFTGIKCSNACGYWTVAVKNNNKGVTKR